MKFYFAPLEGVTGYIYRNAYNKFFGQEIDKYFTPFIVPTMNYCFTSKELNDIKPEHNKNMKVIPQILTNNVEYFLSTTEKLNEFGYDEINLNLGCPSGTVVSKFKGSGFLAKREELDMFLEEIFSRANCKISLKTRIGKDSPNEFYELIKIFNKYPLEELIIHPRIRQDFYKNTPNMEVFKDAIKLSKNPLVYNGDIFSVEDFKKFKSECPSIDTVMLGRGLMANPGLIGEIKEKSIDVAFLPLDSRQGNFYYLGFDYFMRNTNTNLAFPMHFWRTYSLSQKLKNSPYATSYKDKIIDINSEGETFNI